MARLDLSPLQSQVDQVEPTGWVSKAATTLNYTIATRTVTLTVGGSPAVFYSGAKRFTLAAAAAPTIVHPNTTGIHYFFYDGSTTLQTSMTPWTIGGTGVPVAAVYWNATTANGVILDERHGIQMDGNTHAYLHYTQGTQIISGFAASNYVLDDPVDASITPDIASGVIADEDLQTTVPALAAGVGVYKVWYRSGANGDWTWEASNFPFTSGTYIHYNQLTGGVWTRTELTTAKYMNMYVFATPILTTGMGLVWFMGQSVFNSLAEANAENFSNLAFGVFPLTEAAALYKLTFSTLAGNASTGKVQLEALTRIVGSTVSITQTGINDHSGLSGLSGTNVHPASSISVDTSTFGTNLSAADDTVQKALATLDDLVTGSTGDPLFIQSTQPGTSKYMWWDTSTSVPTLWIEDGT